MSFQQILILFVPDCLLSAVTDTHCCSRRNTHKNEETPHLLRFSYLQFNLACLLSSLGDVEIARSLENTPTNEETPHPLRFSYCPFNLACLLHLTRLGYQSTETDSRKCEFEQQSAVRVQMGNGSLVSFPALHSNFSVRYAHATHHAQFSLYNSKLLQHSSFSSWSHSTLLDRVSVFQISGSISAVVSLRHRVHI